MLEVLGDSIWCADGDHWMPGRVYFPVRMTIVRLDDGRLWLHSPIAWTKELGDAVDALGPVAFLVAPNLLHHLYLGAWAERYPAAKVVAAPGLSDKRPDLRIDRVLGEEDPGWGASIEALPIEGVPAMSERVFFHRPSRSLIVTDLLFNIHRWKGWMTGLVLIFSGARRRLAQSRVARAWTKDRAAAGASVQRMLAWRFERLIPAHGDVLEGPETHARVEAALAWMLAGASRALPAADVAPEAEAR